MEYAVVTVIGFVLWGAYNDVKEALTIGWDSHSVASWIGFGIGAGIVGAVIGFVTSFCHNRYLTKREKIPPG